MEKNFIKYKLQFQGSDIEIIAREGERSDEAIISLVFQNQMFSTERFPDHHRALINYYSKILDRNLTPAIIDAGANIGTASLYFSSLYDKAICYSIEPDLENYGLLSSNMNLNNKSFVGFQGALPSNDGLTYLNTSDFGSIGFRTGDKGDTQVNSFGLSQLIESLPASAVPFILKIDIEGAETEVFSVDSPFLSKIPLIIMEPHDWMLPFEASSKNFYSEISKHQSDILMHGENIFCFNVNILKDCS